MEVEAGLKWYPRYLWRTTKSAGLWPLRLWRNCKQTKSDQVDVAIECTHLD